MRVAADGVATLRSWSLQPRSSPLSAVERPASADRHQPRTVRVGGAGWRRTKRIAHDRGREGVAWPYCRVTRDLGLGFCGLAASP